jgi:hypothetical protein
MFINRWCASIMRFGFLAGREESTMPSLHLDIPSIDWIERPPRAERSGGGRASPVPEAPAPHRERAKPAQRDMPQPDRWPREPAGIPA